MPSPSAELPSPALAAPPAAVAENRPLRYGPPALAELREWLESVIRPLRDLIVTVGSLDRPEAACRFERALAEVSGVAEVRLRRYEGIDRAIVDVGLEQENT